jgi:glutathione S-transferase
MEFPALVTILALLEYMFFTMRVGFSRGKYGVEAPATTGNPEWERLYRGQQNTLEQLAIFLPALWIFSSFVNADVGAGIGVLFLVGRPLYFFGYARDPKSRTAGFLMGFLANLLLVLGSLGALVLSLT